MPKSINLGGGDIFLHSTSPEKTALKTFINTKYKTKELIKKIGMYFKPLLMLPFSTIETIRDEKKDITPMAAIEKYLKLSGDTTTSPIHKGNS